MSFGTKNSNSNERCLVREDSLEYFIKFPPSQNQFIQAYPNDDECVDNFNLVYDEVNTPIVLLFGWAGCQDRYLMKYSKIYEDQGWVK